MAMQFPTGQAAVNAPDARHRSGMLSAVAIAFGALAGLGLMAVLVGTQTRRADEAGLGLNTRAVFETHGRGAFHFANPQELATAARDDKFDGMRKLLWLGASQIYGINGYRDGQHNVAYRVFDALIDERVATLALSLPLLFPQEQAILLRYAMKRMQLSGVIIAAVYPDMRHDTSRPQIAELLGETAPKIQDRRTAISRADRSSESLMALSEGAITSVFEAWFGMETLRRSGRTLAALTLEDIRRYVESLRARYTRDLSRYRVPILPQSYAANWRAWDEMLAATKAAGIPTLVYIAPRPTDFYPFDPAGYDAFKRDMERLARRQEAAFANFENVVPNNMWGLVDISFGFYARDPFHFTAEGHALFGRAMVPEIRRSLLRDARPQ